MVLLTAATLALAAWFRPLVNLSKDAGLEDGQHGYNALAEGRDAEAVEHFERAVSLSPKQPSLWYNLGIAHPRTGKLEQAARAYKQAATLAADDPT